MTLKVQLESALMPFKLGATFAATELEIVVSAQSELATQAVPFPFACHLRLCHRSGGPLGRRSVTVV